MQPPNAILARILAPGAQIIATVVKFVEQPEKPNEKKTKDKFKIVSLVVKDNVEYTPELEQVERHNKHLAEAKAAQEARKKPQEEKAIPKGNLGKGLVIGGWNAVAGM